MSVFELVLYVVPVLVVSALMCAEGIPAALRREHNSWSHLLIWLGVLALLLARPTFEIGGETRAYALLLAAEMLVLTGVAGLSQVPAVPSGASSTRGTLRPWRLAAAVVVLSAQLLLGVVVWLLWPSVPPAPPLALWVYALGFFLVLTIVYKVVQLRR